MRVVDAPLSETVGFLAFLLAWGGGQIPVFLDGGARAIASVRSGEELLRRARAWDFEQSRQVEVGLPRGAVSVLAVPLDTRASARFCGRFRPAPSMVLKLGTGAKRIALWGLNEELPEILATDANKRLAYRLRAPYRFGELDAVRIPVPGTFLRVGRARPAPVLVTRMNVTPFSRSQVVARLRDPPRPYIERLREGLVT